MRKSKKNNSLKNKYSNNKRNNLVCNSFKINQTNPRPSPLLRKTTINLYNNNRQNPRVAPERKGKKKLTNSTIQTKSHMTIKKRMNNNNRPRGLPDGAGVKERENLGEGVGAQGEEVPGGAGVVPIMGNLSNNRKTMGFIRSIRGVRW